MFGIGPFLRARMLDHRNRANHAKQAVAKREVMTQLALSSLSAVLAGGGLVWAVLAAGAGELTPGAVAVFVAAVSGTQNALVTLTIDVARTHHSLLMFGHYREVTTAAPDPVRPGSLLPAPLRTGIELRDVWFRYSERHPWILRGVDLFIPAATSISLVGLNGAGKSTLVKLLCRFYDPTRGRILWDGIDIRLFDVSAYRDRIGAVFQDYMHYDMTAEENIALGDLRALDDHPRLADAARRAGIHEALSALPHGYGTLLSRTYFSEADKDDPDTGLVLSEGQWQRLSLARGLLRDDRDVMILDEPSAGLDAQAEDEIHSSLRSCRAGRISVLISHRLNAVRHADMIVVLGDGRIAESGRHAELLSADGEYARLFRLQSAGYGPDNEGATLGGGVLP
ncbi:ABC transporter ATP-binding protein [Nonomuraea roseoviolacea]|uniref:ABC-type multidrug transport system fused ATPase/permease subunit n=1 Tax=Nonomuraea roseoviolacea subsp. carminata TaxID=160689 RepID=A0ABT1JZ87_9ACTN|nr:ABC transporter ATP-binding protein [Nonomuraea roseoviolacea]MCP2347072.1 ABC-type multidrug transport system fused ATPase/permease subunit [Nonomuraea roseoviolacea subsp. carminata]